MDQAHYQQKLVLIEYQTQASLEEPQNQSLFVCHVPVSEQMTIKRTSGHTQNAAPSDLNNESGSIKIVKKKTRAGTSEGSKDHTQIPI